MILTGFSAKVKAEQSKSKRNRAAKTSKTSNNNALNQIAVDLDAGIP
jgi:hypothetical protein